MWPSLSFSTAGLPARGDGRVRTAQLQPARSPIVTPHRLMPQVEDRSGCLNKVTGIFARHGCNAQSLGFFELDVDGVCLILLQVEDRPGCLNEVTGVFARRGFNVQSLAVGTSETPGRSRITMVVPGGSDHLQNLIKQVLQRRACAWARAPIESGRWIPGEGYSWSSKAYCMSSCSYLVICSAVYLGSVAHAAPAVVHTECPASNWGLDIRAMHCDVQVYKVIFVMKITNLTDVPHIARELMMLKVYHGSLLR